ncbi:MAG: hypothetical protein A2Y94_00020 [Caldithrix sp. RBG_13_44_9]|nr:MAG: hypothetical protein A2Y94_00020 [Caldithrix sp. RBG_13_44_9]
MDFTAVKISLLTLLLVGIGAGLLAWYFGESRIDSNATIQLLPGDLKWNKNPNLHGLETALLVGNPDAPESYAERIKLPAGCRLIPHSHPNQPRMVTVLSGTLYFAFGEKFDESKLTALPAGSFFTEPKDLPHYSMTKEEVILQLNAIGPAGTTYVETRSESKEE